MIKMNILIISEFTVYDKNGLKSFVRVTSMIKVALTAL